MRTSMETVELAHCDFCQRSEVDPLVKEYGENLLHIHKKGDISICTECTVNGGIRTKRVGK